MINGSAQQRAEPLQVLNYAQLLKYIRRELAAPVLLILGAVLLQQLGSLSPAWVEHFYTRWFYPHLILGLSKVSRLVAFSLAEVSLLFLIVFVLGVTVRLCFKFYTASEGRVWVLAKAVRNAFWFMAITVWAFLLSFGLNYQRPLLFDLLSLERRQPDKLELKVIGSEIVTGINLSYDASHTIGSTVPVTDDTIHLLEESYRTAAILALLPQGDFARPKPVWCSREITRLGIGGIYSPFTAEANYNKDVPDFQLPFTMAHEMAHQRGVARESEANFIAFVVCINSRNPFVRYSGYREGLGVLSELYRMEPEDARVLFHQLGNGFREDSRRAAAFWSQARGIAGVFGQSVNDLYLRSNRVKSGARDYSRSTELIIGYYLRKMNDGELTRLEKG